MTIVLIVLGLILFFSVILSVLEGFGSIFFWPWVFRLGFKLISKTMPPLKLQPHAFNGYRGGTKRLEFWFPDTGSCYFRTRYGYLNFPYNYLAVLLKGTIEFKTEETLITLRLSGPYTVLIVSLITFFSLAIPMISELSIEGFSILNAMPAVVIFLVIIFLFTHALRKYKTDYLADLYRFSLAFEPFWVSAH